MKENFPRQNNGWTRIFKKKWFFPSMYLLLAALLLTAVFMYQGMENRLVGSLDDQEEETSETVYNDMEDPASEPVVKQEEMIKMPVESSIQSEIVTKFYEYDADVETQEKGLNLYNNRYYQSTGVDIVEAAGEVFDVVASLSGTVMEVKEDPLLGHVVTISHEENIETTYASLGEVTVDAGEKVKQGQKIGVAGKNLFSADHGNHVHFEIQHAGVEVNPETYFNETVSKLKSSSKATMEEEAPVEEEDEQAEQEQDDDDDQTDEDKEDENEDEAPPEEDEEEEDDSSIFNQ